MTSNFQKMFSKSKYLVGILTFLISNKVIRAFQARYIKIKLRLKKLIYTIKELILLVNAVLVNSFLLMILIYK